MAPFKMKGFSGFKQSSPTKVAAEYIDVIDPEGNVKTTVKQTGRFKKSQPGREYYENLRKEAERLQLDPKKYTEGIGSAAAGEGDYQDILSESIPTSPERYTTQRRLTGYDLYQQRLAEAGNDPHAKAAAKEEWQKFKQDNPDKWQQDKALYDQRSTQKTYENPNVPVEDLKKWGPSDIAHPGVKEEITSIRDKSGKKIPRVDDQFLGEGYRVAPGEGGGEKVSAIYTGTAGRVKEDPNIIKYSHGGPGETISSEKRLGKLHRRRKEADKE